MEYLDFLEVTQNHAYINLCIHASAFCGILQPTEQPRASTEPLVKQLLKGVLRKKPPARVRADTWDVKKVLDLLYAWEKPWAFNYTHLTLKLVMILALVTVNVPTDLNLLRITPKTIKMTEDLVTYNKCFGWRILSQSLIWAYYNSKVGKGWMPMSCEAYKRIHSQNQRQVRVKWEGFCNKTDGPGSGSLK